MPRTPDNPAPRGSTDPKIDDRLLCSWSDLLLCSRCLKHGIRRAVGQVISERHRLRALCTSCRDQSRTTGASVVRQLF